MLEYATYSAAAFLSRRMPLAFSYWLGLRVADLFHRFDPVGRAGVTANLTRILRHRGVNPAPGHVEGLVRKTYQHFGKYLVDFFRYSQSFHQEVGRKVSLENEQYLEQARAGGRGVLMLTAHVGNWELGGLVLGLRGVPITTVFRPFGIAHLDRLFADQRAARGIRAIPLGRAVRGLIEAVRRGDAAALLGDRDFTGRGVDVEFFGAPARMPDGAARLASITGVPIVPAFILRQIDDRFLFRFYPPIDPRDAGSVGEIQARCTRALEDVIGEHPHQWFVFRDFWDVPAQSEGKGAGP